MHRLVNPVVGLTLLMVGCVTTPPVGQNVMYDNYTLRPPARSQSPGPAIPPTRYTPVQTSTPLRETWYPKHNRLSNRWKSIVLHHSATQRGGAKLFDKHHRQKGWDGLGYHFVIGNGSDTPDGVIEVGSRWQHQKHGAHCKSRNNFYNEHGIGICLVGDFTRQPPSQRQLESLYKLTRFLSQACKIPAGRIVTHKLINKKTKCPGDHFPVAAVRRYIATSSASTGFPISSNSMN